MYSVSLRAEKSGIDPVSVCIILASILLCIILSIRVSALIKTNPISVLGIRTDVVYVEVLNKTISSMEQTILNKGDMPQAKFQINPFNLSNTDVVINSKDTNNTPVTPVNSAIAKPSGKGKPRILIYHTHSTEAYTLSDTFDKNQSKSVCAVGDVLAQELQSKYGISVIHDKTVNDIDYTVSYQRSAETVDSYLKTYGDFDMIIDLHRDSITDKKTVTSIINGQNVANFRFVMCKANPHFEKNMQIVNGLIKDAQQIGPSYCRGIYYYNHGTNYFNQAKSNNAFLVEVGSVANTLDEAKISAKYLAKILAEYLNAKK